MRYETYVAKRIGYVRGWAGEIKKEDMEDKLVAEWYPKYTPQAEDEQGNGAAFEYDKYSEWEYDEAQAARKLNKTLAGQLTRNQNVANNNKKSDDERKAASVRVQQVEEAIDMLLQLHPKVSKEFRELKEVVNPDDWTSGVEEYVLQTLTTLREKKQQSDAGKNKWMWEVEYYDSYTVMVRARKEYAKNNKLSTWFENGDWKTNWGANKEAFEYGFEDMSKLRDRLHGLKTTIDEDLSPDTDDSDPPPEVDVQDSERLRAAIERLDTILGKRYVAPKDRKRRVVAEEDEVEEETSERATLYAAAQMLFYYTTTLDAPTTVQSNLLALVEWIKQTHGNNLEEVDVLLNAERKRRLGASSRTGPDGPTWVTTDLMTESETSDFIRKTNSRVYDFKEWSVQKMSEKLRAGSSTDEGNSTDVAAVTPEFYKFIQELNIYHREYDKHLERKPDPLKTWEGDVPDGVDDADPWWWLVRYGYDFDARRAARINFFYGKVILIKDSKRVEEVIPDENTSPNEPSEWVPHAYLADWYRQQEDANGFYQHSEDQYLSRTALGIKLFPRARNAIVVTQKYQLYIQTPFLQHGTLHETLLQVSTPAGGRLPESLQEKGASP